MHGFRSPRVFLLFSPGHSFGIAVIAPLVSVPLLRTALSPALSKSAELLESPVTLSLTVFPLAHTLGFVPGHFRQKRK